MKETGVGFRKNDTVAGIQHQGLEYEKEHHTDRSHF